MTREAHDSMREIRSKSERRGETDFGSFKKFFKIEIQLIYNALGA